MRNTTCQRAATAALALALGTMSTAACGRPWPLPGGGAPVPVTGRVTQSPTASCPITRPEECEPAPVAAAEVRVETEAGTVAAQGRTGLDGTYRLMVAPGTYTLVVRPGTGPYPRCQPVDLEVRPGQPATRDVDCDSGIRTVLPAG